MEVISEAIIDWMPVLNTNEDVPVDPISDETSESNDVVTSTKIASDE